MLSSYVDANALRPVTGLDIGLDFNSPVKVSDLRKEIAIQARESEMFQQSSEKFRGQVDLYGRKIEALKDDNSRIDRPIELSSIRNVMSARIFVYRFVDKFKMRIEAFISGSSLTEKKRLNNIMLDCLEFQQDINLSKWALDQMTATCKSISAEQLQEILDKHLKGSASN